MDISYYKNMEPFFDSWRIRRLLGEGSFGKVFEIERTEFGHTYLAAMKAITIPQSQSEIRSIMSDGMDVKSVTDYYHDFVEEVIREFELMSKLKGNSNIVSYEDHRVIKHQNGIGWDILIRMELLTPLLDHMKNHIMPEQEILSLGIDICKALESCQKYHIIHRDIKPENIFLSANGDFKLGDFGIARTMEKTVDDMSKKGTYTYMAPEVYKGETYGSNVDTYSLGIVLYRLLNHNRAPFLPPYPDPITYGDRQKATMRRISGEPLPGPSSGSGRLAEIIFRACAYRPEDRYSSPEEMRRDLEILAYGNSRVPADDSTEFLSDDSTELLPAASTKLSEDGSTQMLTDDEAGTFSREETGVEETKTDDSDVSKEDVESESPRWKMLSASRARLCMMAAVVLCLALSIIFARTTAGKKGEENPKGTNVSRTSEKEQDESEKKAVSVKVPLFVGMTRKEVADALQKIEKKYGATFTVSEYNKEYNAAIPKGKVAAQSLEPGKKVKTSEKLVLSLSLGPKKVTMPGLINMKEKDAEASLEKLNLHAKILYQYSDNVASGCVMAQSVNEKEEIYEGTTVELTVSKGAVQQSSAAGSSASEDNFAADSSYSAPQSAGTPANANTPPVSSARPSESMPVPDVSTDNDSDLNNSDSGSENYDSGFDPGYDSGFDPGYDSGSDPGYDSGFDPGYDSGSDPGYDSGFDSGSDSG